MMQQQQNREINTIDQTVSGRIKCKTLMSDFNMLSVSADRKSDHGTVSRWGRFSLEKKYCDLTAA
jgi:hypothetical protein